MLRNLVTVVALSLVACGGSQGGEVGAGSGAGSSPREVGDQLTSRFTFFISGMKRIRGHLWMGWPNGVRAALEELPAIEQVRFESEQGAFIVHLRPGHGVSRRVVRETVMGWGREREQRYEVRFATSNDLEPAVTKSLATRAEPFDLPRLGGGRVVYAPSGRPSLLVFWASWCDPCLAEAPYIEQMHRRHADVLDVISVSIDEEQDEAEVEEVVTRLSLSYPVGLDPEAAVIRQIAGEASIPLTLLADADGAIRYQHTNFEAGDEQQLRAAVDKVLAGGT